MHFSAWQPLCDTGVDNENAQRLLTQHTSADSSKRKLANRAHRVFRGLKNRLSLSSGSNQKLKDTGTSVTHIESSVDRPHIGEGECVDTHAGDNGATTQKKLYPSNHMYSALRTKQSIALPILKLNDLCGSQNFCDGKGSYLYRSKLCNKTQVLAHEFSELHERIALLKNPGIVETLLKLYDTLNFSSDLSQADSKSSLLSFAVTMAEVPEQFREALLPINTDMEPSQEQWVQMASSQLGKLIYLADTESIAVAEKITELSHKEFSVWIENQFALKMNQLCRRLLKLHSQSKKSGQPFPDVVVSAQLPSELAKIVITSAGIVNQAIIPSLAELFIEKGETPHEDYANELEAGMTLLLKDASLRSALQHISVPASESSPGMDLVRISQGLHLEQTVSEADARRTALTALLSHLRQDPLTGSCFVTRLTIQLQQTHPLQCLQDFRQLIERGHLTKSLDDTRLDLPFVLSASDALLSETITFSREGKIRLGRSWGGSLWSSPSLQAAGNCLGVTDIKNVLRSFCDKQAVSGQATVTVGELLTHLQQASSLEEAKTLRGKKFAALAYSKNKGNLLQRAWEAAIAGLAQNNQHTFVLQAILGSLSSLLVSTSDDLLLEKIRKTLINRMRISYSTNYQLNRTSNDGRSSQGAFVLYDAQGDSSADWVRCDTPTLFKSFLTRVLMDSLKDWLETPQASLKHYSSTEKAATQLFSSDVVVQDILNRYRKNQQLETFSLDAHAQLHFTPWLNRAGGDAKGVTSLYYGSDYEMQSKIFHVDGAVSLATHLIKEAHNRTTTHRAMYKPQSLGVRIIGLHAFTLLSSLKDKTLEAHANKDIYSFLEKQVIIPGREVAASKASIDLYRALSTFCLRRFIPSDRSEKFLQKLGGWHEKMTVSQLRAKTVKALVATRSKKMSLNPRIAIELDSFIAEELPQEQREKLQRSSLLLADTNWAEGPQDVYFCLVVNPGTGQPEFWEQRHPSLKLAALDQQLWLHSRPWEIFYPERSPGKDNSLPIKA